MPVEVIADVTCVTLAEPVAPEVANLTVHEEPKTRCCNLPVHGSLNYNALSFDTSHSPPSHNDLRKHWPKPP